MDETTKTEGKMAKIKQTVGNFVRRNGRELIIAGVAAAAYATGYILGEKSSHMQTALGLQRICESDPDIKERVFRAVYIYKNKA